MNDRERFAAIMNYEKPDRMPVYFFGTWPETKARWQNEGLKIPGTTNGSGGPQLESMDIDWETSPDGNGCIWDNQGLINKRPISDQKEQLVEESDSYSIVRSALGGLIKRRTGGSSIPQHLEPDLEPTREDWERFKSYLDAGDPSRWIGNRQRRMDYLNNRANVTCCFGGSLFGNLRDWLGIEVVSYLPYDDPDLYMDMISFLADYYIELNSRFLPLVSFDFAYFHEDCCFSNGPLISPDIYKQFYDKHYRRMIHAFCEMGVPYMLMDSDGLVDDLIDPWLDTGFDIIFPIEIGTWRSDPVHFRQRHGRKMRMFGGIDKHVIPKGETAIRNELDRLVELAEDGGFVPIPDHRIPPDCSLRQFNTYISIFKEVFA